MTLEQFVADAKELTDVLRQRFNQEKVYLAGHSWGTVIGMELVSRFPEKFHSYVGLSQIVNWVENDRIGLKWAKDEAVRRKNKKALAQLEAVGEPPFVQSYEQWGVLRKWQMRFNTMVYSDAAVHHPGMMKVSKVVFQSRDYSLMDVVNTFYHGFRLVYTTPFIREIANIDFARSAPRVAIPVTFLHGAKDLHVHLAPLEAYVKGLEAPGGKQLVILDKSSHAFHPEDARLVEQHLLDQLGR